VDKGLIEKIKTENDIKRYDPVLNKHHHLYCQKSDTILDYYDEELDNLIRDYFQDKKIPNFEIEDIKLHITGKTKNKN
jgi:Fur family peroxide stress response transcriptional regulator